MHPIERLRWIARADGESDSLIAAEAAWTLGELGAEEPAAVLTASRRLVERQPSCGPLWWTCAHLLASDDTFETARRIAVELDSNTVPSQLAAALRSSFTSSDVICATSPAQVLGRALAQRGSYTVRLLASYRILRYELSSLSSAEEVTGYETEDAADALDGAGVLLVEPRLASVDGLFVDASVASVVALAERCGVPVWAVLATGRVLPTQLAAAAVELAGAGELSLVRPDAVARAIDAEASGDLRQALSRTSCPPSTELAHRNGR